jgi:hypothetical protein
MLLLVNRWTLKAGSANIATQSKDAAVTTTTADAPAATDSTTTATAAADEGSATAATIGQKRRRLEIHDRVRLLTSGNDDDYQSCIPDEFDELCQRSWAFAKLGNQWRCYQVRDYCLYHDLVWLDVSSYTHMNTQLCNAAGAAECCAAVY